MLGFPLLQLVHPLDEGAELRFQGALDLHLHGCFDDCQVWGGRGGGDGGSRGRLLHLQGVEDAKLAQLPGPDLIPRCTELPKLVIKVADPLIQGVPLGASLGQPGVSVSGERADNSTLVADEGQGFLLHAGGLRDRASVMVRQGVELLPFLLHVDSLVGGVPHAEGPQAFVVGDLNLLDEVPAATLEVLSPLREVVGDSFREYGGRRGRPAI